MEHLGIKKSYKVLGSLVLLMITASISGCFYDNEEELYPPESCEVTNVSFNNDVVPILKSVCYSCHDLANAPALGDNINLEGHFNFAEYARDNESKLTGSLKWNGQGSPMPKNGSKLDNCSINEIQVWIQEGRLNN